MLSQERHFWCATEVDEDGIFQGSPGNSGDAWGICDMSDCPTHKETLTWKKDETVKMTLQYLNPALWNGLKLFGTILPWIFVLCLIMTIILPITGKVIIVHDCSHHRIPVLLIAKLEKSELSIHLANKMDNLDRTWKWFINPFFNMCYSKVIDLFGFWNDFNETYPDSMGESTS